MFLRLAARSSALVVALAGALCVEGNPVAAQGPQSVLGPGMYVFQTRTRASSCGDDERTGYVSTFMAPIHGIPGSRSMRMSLLNSEYWPSWRITVDDEDRVMGEAVLSGATGADAPRNRFSVRLERARFVGTGRREYRLRGRACHVEYDALLRRIDQL